MANQIRTTPARGLIVAMTAINAYKHMATARVIVWTPHRSIYFPALFRDIFAAYPGRYCECRISLRDCAHSSYLVAKFLVGQQFANSNCQSIWISGRTSSPLRPSSIISSGAPHAVETTATPAAIASAITKPNPRPSLVQRDLWLGTSHRNRSYIARHLPDSLQK